MNQSTCSVESCDRKVLARGYCDPHYQRVRKYGDPRPSIPVESRKSRDGVFCGVDGCGKSLVGGSAELCGMHHQRWKRNGECGPAASSIAAKNSPCAVCGELVRDGSGRRKHCSDACQVADSRHKGSRPKEFACRLCGKSVDMTRRIDGRLPRTDTVWCRDCGRESPEALRFRNWGVTPEQYATALEAGCQICGSHPKVLHIDHDHSCCSKRTSTCGKCVRGFLCGSCNRGLGIFRDDTERLRAAIAYLGE